MADAGTVRVGSTSGAASISILLLRQRPTGRAGFGWSIISASKEAGTICESAGCRVDEMLNPNWPGYLTIDGRLCEARGFACERAWCRGG